jgi:hypothetical protein
MLSFCDTTGPVRQDCSQLRDTTGGALACQVVAGFADCVLASTTAGCRDESSAGRCDGNTVVTCQSVETGVVTRTDCASVGQVCRVSNGSADCIVADSTGCGTETAQGSCNGDVARFCNEATTSIVETNCATTNQTCGLDANTQSRCIARAPAAGTSSVSGTFRYEKRVFDMTTKKLGPTPQIAPIRFATVEVRLASNNAVLAEGATDANGAFDIPFNSAGAVSVVALAAANNANYALAVRDCPELNTDSPATNTNCPGGGLGNIHAVASTNFTPAAGANDLGVITATDAGSSGAFNIFEIGVRVYDFARANLGGRPDVLTVEWKKGTKPNICESCYTESRSAGGHVVFVEGRVDDQDEYDDSVLGHEYGHFVENVFFTANSPGGDHDGTPTNPLLAWGEGYGTFFGCLIQNSSVYIDARPAGGAIIVDISNLPDGNTKRAELDNSRGISQVVSEYMVAEVLWQIANGDGTTTAFGAGPIFDVLGKYIKKFPASPEKMGKYPLDRGVMGVDLVDVLDGWFCRGHDNTDALRKIVRDNHTFPYDFPTLTACP